MSARTEPHRRRMMCPDCRKYGVTLRLRPNGEDHYGCRYCDWFAFSGGHDPSDTLGRNQLRAMNHSHPLAPS